MTAAELTAATALYRALNVFPCTCVYEFAYHGNLVRECHRCKALRAWDELECEALQAVTLAAAQVPT
jgi:hypothetical protein